MKWLEIMYCTSQFEGVSLLINRRWVKFSVCTFAGSGLTLMGAAAVIGRSLALIGLQLVDANGCERGL
jgi:hypothetical protein